MPPRVHLAVDAATAELTRDDSVLAGALASRSIAVEPVVWGGPLPAGATVVLRSVWDYVERPDRFRTWIDALEADGVTVHNDPATVRWNMHKGYLVELAGRGVPIVPTTVIATGAAPDLAAIMAAHGWVDAVVKPAIGGTARHTIHVARVGLARAREHLQALVAREDVLIQQFAPTVVASGELSIVAIAGDVTHVVRKRPAAGEWRVQAEFGGRSERIAVESRHHAVAARALAAIEPVPLYARVDVVDDDGDLVLMELELVDPELFFRLAPDAASRLVDALLA